MIGKNRIRYCLVKYAILMVMAVAALGSALLAVDAIEVIPPPGIQPFDLDSAAGITVAPLGTQDSDLASDPNTPHHGEMIDSQGKTDYCLQCHLYNVARSHKILIEYPPPYRGSEVTFRPLQEVLAMGMKFEDNMITCISCHDLTNLDRYHLALETRTGGHAQKLCYVCHMEIG